jgi:hypothetical protein
VKYKSEARGSLCVVLHTQAALMFGGVRGRSGIVGFSEITDSRIHRMAVGRCRSEGDRSQGSCNKTARSTARPCAILMLEVFYRTCRRTKSDARSHRAVFLRANGRSIAA